MLATTGPSPDWWATTVDVAREAEARGFDALWASERGGPGLDPVPVLAALARVTTEIRLFAVLVAGDRRPPAVTAKALNTLDVLSGGRLTVVLGGDDAVAVAETIAVLNGMAAGGPFTYAGSTVTVTEARCLPRSIQLPHPPVWVHGDGDGLVDVAARTADGWAALAASVAGFDAAAARFDAACRSRERRAHVPRGAVLQLGAEPADAVAAVSEWRAAAVDLVVVPATEVTDVEMIAAACSL